MRFKQCLKTVVTDIVVNRCDNIFGLGSVKFYEVVKKINI